ncbi:MAG: branched-chain amino acid ABC transporter permease [Rhodospirillaceae bacterium]|jgi:branched-chain amino acid transport system permease protein|nr:branched-chain amino acid ABC transporter permease [Rhodospirillaceae bacterium]MBT5456908.1 branched-chain amino acid ABC transporter permease [Rhodospirillaceae bacterium]
MTLATIIFFDALSYAATLFLLSVGLTVVFGVLRILNVSHGGIYALGAYMGTWLALWALELGLPPVMTYPALLLGALIVGFTVGPIIERLLLRRIYSADMHIQLLLTFSILLILDDSMKLIWGMQPLFVSEPYALLGRFTVVGIIYPWYDFMLVGVAIIFGGGLVWLVRGTRYGKLMVSVINDREISLAIGINVNLIFTVAFTIGALAAALGGAFIAPKIAVVPQFALEVVVLAFAVIAIGGMGSIEGAALGSLIVSLARALSIHLAPEFDLVAIYLIMILVLAFRPQGLFGEIEFRKI